uniref:Secreted protein n=1 Tax=Equus caballus TaxID=9796 RepID=A0A3Q2IIK5_HORSE
MPWLSLSWLGLRPVAASPWLLLLLVRASWLLARVLAWTYTFYDNCCHLRCFLQPPKGNWFLGHLGLAFSTSLSPTPSLLWIHFHSSEGLPHTCPPPQACSGSIATALRGSQHRLHRAR